MRGLNVAAVAVAMGLFSTGASAAVLTFDFEDGVAGSPYHATPTDGFSGFSSGVIVADASGKHLKIEPTDIYHWSDFYIFTQSEFVVDGHKFRHWLHLTTFDVFIPGGGEVRSLGIDIPAGQWTTITPDINFWGYLHMWTVGDGAMVDNFQLEESVLSIPEPAAWAMMIAGFGMIGGALRRGRRPDFVYGDH